MGVLELSKMRCVEKLWRLETAVGVLRQLVAKNPGAEDKFVKGRVYALDRGRFGLVRCARSSCVATRRGECACARLRRCLQI